MNWFLSELQRRKVTRVATAYLVAGWIMLQVAATLEQTLNLVPWFDTLIFAILAAAFPIILVLTWFYDITPDGIRRTTGQGDGVVSAPGTTDLLLIGMLLLVVAVGIGQAFFP